SQSAGEVQRCLPAELDKHAFRFFLVVNVEHILEGERLEIKFIARVVISGNGFRIRVNHDCLEPKLAQGKRGVYAAVIEFNTLADPVRTTTQNHNLTFAALASLVLVPVGRIVIRRVSFELRGASVDQPIGGYDR